MKYADIEGFEKKDPFKHGFIDIFNKTRNNLLKYRIRVLVESIGEPAALLDFLDYDFLLAFKTDGTGTKILIADTMAREIRKRKRYSSAELIQLYSGIGIDLVATNVNDMICLGATPIALSDEIAAGHYTKFTDTEFVRGLYEGLQKGCNEANITIPCGESPTQADVVNRNTANLTGSAIGIIKPKTRAIFGKDLKPGDAIFALASNGIHVNGLSLARKLVEKLPKGYFTRFGKKTIGEVLLTPTKIYVKPILELIDQGVDIHYMSNISGSAFKKVMRAKQSFSYVIDKVPRVPKILTHLQKLGNIPDDEMYKTWNMGLGYVVFAPSDQEIMIKRICKKYKIGFLKMGYVEKGKKQVIIKPKNITYID